MERCLVRAVGTGVQVSMLSSGSYLKDLSTYSVLTNGVLGRRYPVGGGGEGDLDGVSEGVLNLYWSVCGDGEGKEKGSFGDFRLDRPDAVVVMVILTRPVRVSWDGTGLYVFGMEVVGRWFRQQDMALGSYLRCS